MNSKYYAEDLLLVREGDRPPALEQLFFLRKTIFFPRGGSAFSRAEQLARTCFMCKKGA
jgi:hypothetical protein